MNELTFLILEIKTERRINGNSEVTAMCIQTDEERTIVIPTSFLMNKKLVKDKFLSAFYMPDRKTESKVQVGTIL